MVPKVRAIISIAVLLLLGIICASAQQEVVVNSADWRDVYSTLIYSNLIGANGHFLTSTPHGPILLYEIPKSAEGVLIITSADRPYYVGYESLMASKGYVNTREMVFDSANLELAQMLTDANKFIVLDDDYGYNAIAVAPFAAKARYYVLFANSRNIDDVQAYLDTRNVEDIIIYGHVDREVKSTLARYEPEILESESGSRFENNMLIADKFAEIANIKQVILTNGEFIEASMLSGNEAILFIGKNNVPPEMKEYIQKKGIDIGVLIGNELIGTATDIRRQLGISVFVKFARGSRIPGGTINPVEDLDRFAMPSYQLSMTVTSVAYNQAMRTLEVTYRNNVDLATYFKTTITVKNSAGDTIAVDGDEQAIFIDGGETKTIVYTKLTEIESVQLTDNLTAEVYTIYGESKTSLENVLRANFAVQMIDVLDSADIEIRSVVYDSGSDKFQVTIENTGTVDVYTSVELLDLWINGEYITAASDSVEKIEPGRQKKIPVSITLEEEDLANTRNEQVTVRALYGERMHALIKSKEARFKLDLVAGNIWIYVAIAAAILTAIVIIVFWNKGKRCNRCRTVNKKEASHCAKCGHAI